MIYVTKTSSEKIEFLITRILSIWQVFQIHLKYVFLIDLSSEPLF